MLLLFGFENSVSCFYRLVLNFLETKNDAPAFTSHWLGLREYALTPIFMVIKINPRLHSCKASPITKLYSSTL